MPKILRMLATAVALAQAALGVLAFSASDAFAQGAGKPIPPPLSLERARYFRDHPTEFAALMATLPVPHDSLGPVSDPPQLAPLVGGVWTAVTAPMPVSGASAPHLMMDGTVLVHAQCTRNWFKLSPNAAGRYGGGTWSSIAPMPSGYGPLYFASQVLADGRLIVNGGEYNFCADAWTPLGAIYSPTTNTWASVSPPSGWTQIGDAQSVVLFDGTYMLADCCTTDEALLNPTSMTWAMTGTGKFDVNDEEGWSLLPSGNVITADAYVFLTCGKNTEKYTTSAGTWATAGPSPVQLSDCSPSWEVGPQVLRPDGSVVMFSGLANGAVAGTAVYNSATGAYVKGANIPAIGGVNYTAKDAPAALLPNGKVLVAVSPGVTNKFPAPTRFVEYALDNTDKPITNHPPGSSGQPSYVFNMLVLPTGQVMVTDGSNTIHLYNPVGGPNAAWAPVITSLSSSTIVRGTKYTINGTQLNGLSEAGGYGDDNQSATDFPLVRVTNTATNHVFYCTTTSQSSRDIGVNAPTSMSFVCPSRIPAGAANLVVVTNGIASAAKSVTIQ